MHPAQQVRVAREVGPAHLVLAPYPLVDAAHVPDHLVCVLDGAVGGDGEVVARALQTAPRVTLVTTVARHPGHGHRVERLEQQRGDPTGEHGGVGVHLPDRVVRGEPALTLGAPDAFGVDGSVVAGHPRPQREAEAPLHETGDVVEGHKTYATSAALIVSGLPLRHQPGHRR